MSVEPDDDALLAESLSAPCQPDIADNLGFSDEAMHIALTLNEIAGRDFHEAHETIN